MRLNLVTLAGLVVALLLTAGPALAEAPHAAAEDKTAFMGLKRWDLGIYTLVVFGLLVFVLGKFAWKPIMEGLQKREEVIRRGHEEADRALAEAHKLRDELTAQRNRAGEEIRGLMDEARRDAARLKEEIKSTAAAEIEADRQRLRREVETAKDQAVQEIWVQAVQIATQVASRAVTHLSPDDQRKLVDQAIKELGQKRGLA